MRSGKFKTLPKWSCFRVLIKLSLKSPLVYNRSSPRESYVCFDKVFDDEFDDIDTDSNPVHGGFADPLENEDDPLAEGSFEDLESEDVFDDEDDDDDDDEENYF